MPVLLLILIAIPLLGCLFTLFANKNGYNAYYVTIFTVTADILVVLRLFSQMDLADTSLQIFESYLWLARGNISLTFSVDVFALLILLGIYLAVIIGLSGLPIVYRKHKILLVLTLYFVWNITGFLLAGDIMTFYVFFAGMLLPLFILIGKYGNFHKKQILFRFFIYNFIGILALLAALLILYKFYNGNVLLNEIALVDMPERTAYIVWIAICLAFLSRIPIWPFHYWISSVNTGIHIPPIYIISNLLPLTGVYGFTRFWPLALPESIDAFVAVIETMSCLTMIFIAVIGMANKDSLYKLFSYSTVYYLLFLLAVVLPTDFLKRNISYALFIFLTVTASLTVLNFHIETQCNEAKCEHQGSIIYMPKLARLLSLFILIAIGLPVSSLFWNNFIIISALFKENFFIGSWVVLAITLAALVLLYELFVIRDLQKHQPQAEEMKDISATQFSFLSGILLILFLSFFNPLWFVL